MQLRREFDQFGAIAKGRVETFFIVAFCDCRPVYYVMPAIRTQRTLRGCVPMCAFEGKATTHSQFLASDKFRVALRERTYLGHRHIIEIVL